MAGIYNVSNIYNSNSKKVSSKLSFELGETFSARVVKVDGSSKEVVLKLTDGWQFPAEFEKPLDFLPEGLTRFQVQGYEDGKLQISLVNKKDEEKDTEKESIDLTLEEQNINLNKDDYKLLKRMVKHGMPLTKDNISKIKTLLDFKGKINLDEREAESFILRYFDSKNITVESDEGKKIAAALKGFFTEFKKIDIDSLLTLIENNIDLTEGNIKSFNKLINQSSTIYNELKDIDSALSNSPISDESSIIKEEPKFSMEDEIANIGRNIKDKLNDTLNEDINRNKYILNDKAIGEQIKGNIKSLITSFKDNNMNEKMTSFMDKLNVDTDKVVDNVLEGQNYFLRDEIFSEDFKEKINKVIDGDVTLKRQTFKSDTLQQVVRTSESMKKGIGDIIDNVLKDEKQLLHSILNEGIERTEDNYKSYIKNNNTNNEEKNPVLMKQFTESVKKELLSSINNTMNDSAYSLKVHLRTDIIESIDNIILANKETFSDKSVENIAQTDALVGSKINTEDKSNAIANKGISGEKLTGDIKTVDIVKQQVLEKTQEMKDIIKELLESKNKLAPEVYDKVIQNLKENINDFKVYNSLSNQYYYLDIPLKLFNDEYQCKILIKDDRSKGKKIDSKDAKMVVSVKTINIGTVDAFIKVKNMNMYVDVKCEENFIKLIDYGRQKLTDELTEMGYNAFINVKRREQEANLVNSRDFFEDSTINAINVRV